MATEKQADQIIALLTSIDKKLGGAAASGGAGGGGTTTSSKSAAKVTRAMLLAALTELKEAQGGPATKRIVTKFGEAKTFDAVAVDKFPAMMAEIKRLMADEGEEATDEDTSDDGL